MSGRWPEISALDGTAGQIAEGSRSRQEHPGHPDNAGEFQALVNTYAVPTKLIGHHGPVTQINGSGNPWGADDNLPQHLYRQINVTTAGNYRFAVDGDDAVEVLIDGVVRYGRYGPHGACNCTTYRSASIRSQRRAAHGGVPP